MSLKDRTLRSARLELRPLSDADADELHDLWTSEGVRRFLWDGEVLPADQTRSIVSESQELFRNRGFGLWGARLAGTSPLMGFGGLWYFRDPPDLELIFGVAERSWGHGYATEIGGTVVAYATRRLRFESVQASTDAANAASTKVLAKLGFVPSRRSVVGGLDTLFFDLTPNAG